MYFRKSFLIAVCSIIGIAAYPHSVRAQCEPQVIALGEYAVTFDANCSSSQSTIQIYWDFNAEEETGAYGLQLEVFLGQNVAGVSGVAGSTTGSWLFTSGNSSVSVSYSAAHHSILLNASRLDCKGREGSGLVFTITFSHNSCGGNVVAALSGSLVMVDNIDIA